MTGDYTKVPLRPGDRWTGARMQAGRVLLADEWNLNLDAAARTDADLARDVIGPAGVVEGSNAFAVTVGPANDLELGAGHMWVGGLEALAPAPFTYSSQEDAGPLPEQGRGLVYLDVFPEHVQPAEDVAELVDPALAPIDSAARTRVGWRVRARSTAAATCSGALDEIAAVAISDATLTITRAAPTAPPDPCDPPGDPLGLVPDGMLRVEVLDAGSPATARFAWSFDNGGAAVAVASFAGDEVVLAPSASVKFATGDLVEVSWLVRRQDRADHGPLYRVMNVAAGPGGDVVTLDRAVPAELTGASGLVLRRWDGQVVGATADRVATLRGADLGVRFRADGTSLLPGDWWGARLRESADEPVELRTNAPPDGIRHAFAPLALVDFSATAVDHDCRPTFPPLTDLDVGAGTCTVVAHPGDDLQARVDELPATGGELCLAAGLYRVVTPVVVRNRRDVVITGVGPATVVRGERTESAIRFEGCVNVEVRHLRVEGGRPLPPGDEHLDGAVTMTGCADVRVVECELFCPDAFSRSQSCLTVRPGEANKPPPDRVRVEDNRFEVGAWQSGMLVIGSNATVVTGNHLRVADPPPDLRVVPRHPLFLRSLGELVAASLVTGPSAVEAIKAVAKAAKATKAKAKATKAKKAAKAKRGGAVPAKKVSASTKGSKRVTARAAAAKAAAMAVPDVGAARAVSIDPKTVFGPLAAPFAAFVAPKRRAQLSPARAAHAFARSLGGRRVDDLDADARDLVARLVRDVRPALHGIVVAGERAGTVQVVDNVVDGTVQGIHVGTSDRTLRSLHAGEVMIARNVVHAVVPVAYDRDRHGIFVGNARSVHVVDNAATLTRPDAGLVRAPTAVEGVRVHGVLGPFLVVRHTSCQRFTVGVRVVPLPPIPGRLSRMWLVAETMAAGGTSGAILPPASDPAFPVEGERNVP